MPCARSGPTSCSCRKSWARTRRTAASSRTGRNGGQYEFLADSIWPQFAYGRNMVYPKGHHGNAVMSKFPIVHFQNHDVSLPGPEKRGLLHCVLQVPGFPQRGARDLRAPGPGRVPSPAAARPAVPDHAHRSAGRRAADRGRRLQRLAPPRQRHPVERGRPARDLRHGLWRAGQDLPGASSRCCRWTASTCATARCTCRWCCRAGPGRTCRTTRRWWREIHL